MLLGVAGVLFTPGDKAEGETIVRFAKTSPSETRRRALVMARAEFFQTVTDLGMSDLVTPTPSVPRAHRGT